MKTADGINYNEFSSLDTVILHRPKQTISTCKKDPASVLHREKINFPDIQNEFNSLVEFYESQGINIIYIEADDYSESYDCALLNMIYTRDLYFMTGYGAVLASMKEIIRTGETRYIKKTFEKIR